MKSFYSLLILLTSTCIAADTTPQANVSLSRYQGRWYEQARYENWFEEGMEQVYTDYSPGPDGSLNVMNSGRNETGHFKQASGRAFPVKDGILEVSFVWPYWWFGAPYHILYVDKDYQAALVSGDDEDYLWLLTRERNPKPEIIKKLKQEAERRGFDTSKLRFTRQ